MDQVQNWLTVQNMYTSITLNMKEYDADVW